jgi:uncharacterized protein (TIGR00255 family)
MTKQTTPVYSMTGFARVAGIAQEKYSFVLSIKTVNHRFLDLQFRIPSGLDAIEMHFRRILKEGLKRGHADLTLTIERDAQTTAGYNAELVRNYLAAFEEARQKHNLSGEPDLNAILRLPGALQAESRTPLGEIETLEPAILAAIEPLLIALNTMRAQEGAALVAILRETLNRLTEAVDKVAGLRGQVLAAGRDRLRERMKALLETEADEQRILQEAAIMAERSDVEEEIDRMRTHIDHFRSLLDGGGEIGKKLDFLLQEMNREANTLLSKTTGLAGKGTEITAMGLAMKSEIEKAREQVQNVE